MVVRESLRLGITGVGLGMLFAASVSPYGAAMLHLVDARDPAVFAGVALTLLGVNALAAALPAWRASGLDPSHALRSE